MEVAFRVRKLIVNIVVRINVGVSQKMHANSSKCYKRMEIYRFVASQRSLDSINYSARTPGKIDGKTRAIITSLPFVDLV